MQSYQHPNHCSTYHYERIKPFQIRDISAVSVKTHNTLVRPISGNQNEIYLLGKVTCFADERMAIWTISGTHSELSMNSPFNASIH